MHIEEIIIDGFKSYAKRTVVQGFDQQFNAITGLNGSGKSNILDSICFVLGISKLEQVRAGSLQVCSWPARPPAPRLPAALCGRTRGLATAGPGRAALRCSGGGQARRRACAWQARACARAQTPVAIARRRQRCAPYFCTPPPPRAPSLRGACRSWCTSRARRA